MIHNKYIIMNKQEEKQEEKQDKHLLLNIKHDQDNKITDISWTDDNQNNHNYQITPDINLNKIINKLGLGYAIKNSDTLDITGDMNILIQALEDIKFQKTIDNLKNLSIKNKYNIIILDIETSDVIQKQRYIVQIAYEIYDQDKVLIKKENIYINHGLINNKQIIDYYSRLEDKIKTTGISLSDALDKLILDLKTCKYFVAHNISFDINHINNNIFNLKKEQVKIIPVCTMRTTRDLVKALDKNQRLKNPKLSELYKYLFNLDMDESDTGAHCGDYDVYITSLCFLKLLDDKYIDLDSFVQEYNIGEKYIKVF